MIAPLEFAGEVPAMAIGSVSQAEARECSPEVKLSREDYAPFRAAGAFSVNDQPAVNCVLLGLDRRGLYLKTSNRPEIGEKIDAVFEKIGKLQGTAAERTEDGVFVALPRALMEGLLDQVRWLETATSQRRDLRMHPHEPDTSIRINGNQDEHPAKIINFSLAGASLQSGAPVKIGDRVTFPNLTQGTVVWVDDGGRFGLQFQRAFRPADFSWITRL
jgi:hypothetical protein